MVFLINWDNLPHHPINTITQRLTDEILPALLAGFYFSKVSSFDFTSNRIIVFFLIKTIFFLKHL
ncbi:hypothetical protein ADICYQ_3462 [Cyclobacterium qasimii M12-11B]|uniref:Uncharacterized protein n=1 Tax=Cyclobacterium qasimii M12-11B TaxID=641524 RepID=S7WTK7_9BACT|nr:hypothetical protein ADICYQ_3462 [Cyclobacterium qasimii M12-11B]